MRLSAARHLTFGRNPEYPEYPGLAGFFAERSAPYGVAVDPEAALPGNRNSYAYMSTRMLDELGLEPPDLVVIAHALPDCAHETSLSGRVHHHLVTRSVSRSGNPPRGSQSTGGLNGATDPRPGRPAGDPFVFAVSDQGRATGFAAVTAAGALARGGRFGRVAVLVLDQGSVIYPDPVLAKLDLGTDHAVGLLFAPEQDGEPTRLRHRGEVPPEGASRVLAAELAELAGPDRAADVGAPDSADPVGAGNPADEAAPDGQPDEDGREVVVVLSGGPHSRTLSTGLDEAFSGAEPFGGRYRVRQARHGQLCTAVWSELARELTFPAPSARTVIAAEYDEALRCLALAAFDLPASPRYAVAR